jgi:lipid-A-disaccharide synthase
MTAPLRILMVAGEASGDLHGAALLNALRRRVPALDVAGVGGARLRAAGMRVLVDTEHVATMGLVETFGTLGRLLRTYRRLVRVLDEERPELVVLIDYPEFNLRLARQAKRRGIPVFYVIAPQVWAWRRGRVRTIAERVDKLGAIFPFEADLYNNGRPLAEFIGHPLLDVVRPSRPAADTRARYGLTADRPVLALLPGSRKKEVGYLAAPMCAAAAQLARDGWQPIIALAESLTPAELQAAIGGAIPVPVAHGDTYDVVAAADAAIVASGTATLETALLGCPMVIVYRMAPLTYWIARRLVDVPWIGMPNIILQRPVFPELVQSAATPEAMAAAVRAVHARRDEMAQALGELRGRLGAPGAADRAAELAVSLIRRQPVAEAVAQHG